uniref:NADH-ubiquinone oxidoreductase chain 3 n=1 Tax=Embiophila sp. TaxID=2931291 RepID=A0A8T9ZY38_9HEMI|nr:NADH dehydrogenase subunit 3 [Embiophila sp.]
MIKLIMLFSVAAIISMGLMVLCTMIFKKSITDREKMSPFECGFDPQSSSRIPFSLKFFQIAILFLIFDIEIVIILPMTTTLKSSSTEWWSMTSSLFIMILLLGLYHEWNQGILKWTK